MKGDLLASWSASFKTTIWPGPKGMLNQHIFKVTPAEGVSKEFLRHAIEYSYTDLRLKQVGMGMMHLRRGDFLGHRVPKLQLDEQKSLPSTWMRVIEACKSLDQHLDQTRLVLGGKVAEVIAAIAD